LVAPSARWVHDGSGSCAVDGPGKADRVAISRTIAALIRRVWFDLRWLAHEPDWREGGMVFGMRVRWPHSSGGAT
jgi:hypothetical protein